MNPENHPQIIDPLAAEYVLGTLRGPARARFERWRSTSQSVQERCRFWEDNLMRLAARVPTIQPPPHVWQGIRTRLNLPNPAPRRRVAQVSAIAASVLLIVGLAAVLYWRGLGPGPVSEVATISAPTGVSIWRVEVYGRGGQLILHAGRLPAHPPGHDFELWALPKDGKPVSLGVMPLAGTSRRELTAAQRAALATSAQVAVTLEQLGGSPTGQPTTTPIYVVPLRAVT